MRVNRVVSYEADDGTKFNSKEECEAYELSSMFKPLYNMKAETIAAILDRADEKAKERGDLIEKLAARVRTKRLADGDYKRPPREGEGVAEETAEAAE